MLYWALMFLVVALVAAVFGFGGIASTAAGMAQILFVIAIILFVVSLFSGFMRGSLTSNDNKPQNLEACMSLRRLCVVVAGALAAACSTTETRTVVVPAPADDSCTYYGYAPGTEGYRICVEREAAARPRGRMAANYAEARIAPTHRKPACPTAWCAAPIDTIAACSAR